VISDLMESATRLHLTAHRCAARRGSVSLPAQPRPRDTVEKGDTGENLRSIQFDPLGLKL
jgi:hypothetical protein